jgi:hypothetical protein
MIIVCGTDYEGTKNIQCLHKLWWAMKRATMWYFLPGSSLSFHSAPLTMLLDQAHNISRAAGRLVKVIRTLTISDMVANINPVTVFIIFRWYDALLLVRIVSWCSW